MIWIRTVILDPRLSLDINNGEVGFGCQALTCQLCLGVQT